MTRIASFGTALLLVGMSGCSSVPLDSTGSMVAVHRFGEFRMLLNSTAPAASTVAQGLLTQFDLYQTGIENTTYSSKITARNRSDQQIVIDIEEVNSRQCMLRIRWGAGGDLNRSRRFYEAVEAGLASR